jgi:hypothetical protein
MKHLLMLSIYKMLLKIFLNYLNLLLELIYFQIIGLLLVLLLK